MLAISNGLLPNQYSERLNCGHSEIIPECQYCLDGDIRVLFKTGCWDRALAESARIAAVTGLLPRFGTPSPNRLLETTSMPLQNITLPSKCIHLGITVANLGGCRTTYECENGHGKVRACVECRSCKDFEADDVV